MGDYGVFKQLGQLNGWHVEYNPLLWGSADPKRTDTQVGTAPWLSWTSAALGTEMVVLRLSRTALDGTLVLGLVSSSTHVAGCIAQSKLEHSDCDSITPFGHQ